MTEHTFISPSLSALPLSLLSLSHLFYFPSLSLSLPLISLFLSLPLLSPLCLSSLTERLAEFRGVSSVCVCLCMHVSVCLCVCACVCERERESVCACVCERARACVWRQTSRIRFVHTYTASCTHTHTHLCTHTHTVCVWLRETAIRGCCYRLFLEAAVRGSYKRLV